MTTSPAIPGRRRLGMIAMATPALLLTAAAPSADSGQEAYADKPLPDRSYARPQDVFAEVLRSFPEGGEGRQGLNLDVAKDEDGSQVVLLTLTGLLSDSVEASQHRAVLRKEESGWRVIRLGERWRCYLDRGGQEWTTSPCS